MFGCEKMIGVIANSAAIIIGVLVGLLLKKFIPKEVGDEIFKAIGLGILLIGLSGALKSDNLTLVIASIAIGTFVGTLIDLDKKMNDFGKKVEKRFVKDDSSTFAKGFVNSSILFCSGAMAILGSFEAGISSNYEILFFKSLIDGISSIFLTMTYGVGVLLSSVATFIYQGFFTLTSAYLAPFITDAMLVEISAVGNLMIAAIGFNLIGASKIKIANLLPGVLVPVVYFLVFG